MTIKTLIPCLSLAVVLLPGVSLSADDSFIPWNSDVKVADEITTVRRTARTASRPVYGGPQAAGYLLIRFFQVVISPQDGPNCRFHPTCSAYAVAAVERFGLLAGSILAGDRVLRCNPYTPPGEDPVPREILGR